MPASHLMQAGEIEALAKIFVSLGVDKIRLTGGEPLVRKDFDDILVVLSKLPVDLTITTNGVRLGEFLPQIKSVGIRSLNISLDTLDAEKFKLITRRDYFDTVWNNIHKAVQEGLHVKVNVVAMKGINENEINDFVEWTRNIPVHVRFIEFMPFTGNKWSSNKVVPLAQIMQEIQGHFSVIKLRDDIHDTAKKFMVPGHAGTFAVISTMTAAFCGTCNRMRLTADGKMKNCLFSKEETDLLTALRGGEDVEALIRESVMNKHEAHGGQFVQDFNQINSNAIENRSMIAIGG